MVVSPMEALADVGYTWREWGGGWSGADAVHFELPGASEWARSQLDEEPRKSIGAWIDSVFNGIPWYISAVLPTALLTKSEPLTFDQVQTTLRKYGIKL
jgi:hypothetical protein